MVKLGSIVIYGKGKAMDAVSRLLDELNIEYIQMDDLDVDEEVIKRSKTIIVTPGIKPSHRLYSKYENKILSELSFVGKLIKSGFINRWNNITLVGITGTNGKSTTTRALYQSCYIIENKKDISDKKNVYIGGNFDTPLSGIIVDIIQQKKTDTKSIIILEASSFMLWHLQYISFDIGILLNIAHDHIDRHGSMKDYLQSKLNVLMMSEQAITTNDIRENAMKDQMRGITLLHRLFPKWKTINHPNTWIIYNVLENFSHPQFPGKHNAQNFGAVFSALQLLYGKEIDVQIFSILQPVAHRLNPIQIQGNITLYDDSVSSSAHALQAALEAIESPLILIAGGYDNGENYDGLLSLLKTKVTIGIFYGQTRIHLYPLGKQVNSDVFMVETLEEAIRLALEKSKKHNIQTIVYSPGAKSFDQFENVYHRITTFEKLIEEYR